MSQLTLLPQTHYLVYKITNLLNGNFYIGAHKTKNKNDSYMGSGHAIKKAIQKYGKNNFKKEILFELNSEQEMYDKERELVVVGEGCYNLINGGGFPIVFTEEMRRKIGEANKFNHSGEQNSQYGRIWVTDGLVNKKIHKDDAVPDGYKLGRLYKRNKKIPSGMESPAFGKYFINNGKENRLIKNDELIPEGYKKGRVVNFIYERKPQSYCVGEKNPRYGEQWVTNGIQNMVIKKGDNVPQGYAPGRIMPTDWIWITNGQKNSKLKKELPIPDGFWNGKTGRKNMVKQLS